MNGISFVFEEQSLTAALDEWRAASIKNGMTPAEADHSVYLVREFLYSKAAGNHKLRLQRQINLNEGGK